MLGPAFKKITSVTFSCSNLAYISCQVACTSSTEFFSLSSQSSETALFYFYIQTCDCRNIELVVVSKESKLKTHMVFHKQQGQ